MPLKPSFLYKDFIQKFWILIKDIKKILERTRESQIQKFLRFLFSYKRI